MKLRVKDVTHGGSVAKRAMVTQQKTRQHVQFEITEHTRDAISRWIAFEVDAALEIAEQTKV